MADVVLQYQRAAPGALSSTRRAIVKQLRFWAVILLLFAVTLGGLLFEQMVVDHVGHWVMDPLSNGHLRIWVYTRIYHWPRLLLVAPFMVGPLVLAAAYWMLAGAMARRAQRKYTILALLLAVLHALGCCLFALTFLMFETASLHITRWDITAVLTAVGSLLGIAMVPGMLYLSIRLMDLLREPRFVAKIPVPPVPRDHPTGDAANPQTPAS